MRDFLTLSGPWRGMSIQDGRRIYEVIQLTITPSFLSGEGHDADGVFQLEGTYDAATAGVRLVRRYSWTAEPSQQGVGVPYDYEGHWDGQQVSGNWMMRDEPSMGGWFEMWPESEEDLEELRRGLKEILEPVHAGQSK